MYQLFWFEIVLSAIVLVYAVVLVFKMGAPLYRYRFAKDRTVQLEGVIDSFYGEEAGNSKRNSAPSFYPIYSCEVDGKKKILNGSVRYFGKGSDFIGQTAQLLYDKETGELWCEEDLPRMKKLMLLRLALMGAMVVIMVLSSVLF